MNVMVIGSGGREHAICWKLSQSPEVGKIYVAPGNGGSAFEDKCLNVALPGGDPSSPEGMDFLAGFARKNTIELTVVGPEAPLAAGITDVFRKAGLAVIGPDKGAAELEASKAFSKSFMAKYGVRAAESESYRDYESALARAEKHFSGASPAPLVIKADGLAAGKGVVIAQDTEEARTALHSFMREKSLGEAGQCIVLEDFLEGQEVSVLAAVSVVPGRTGVILPFVSARDHKRRFDGARGPNTGGMGAIAPVPDFTGAAAEDFRASILEPTLRGMEAEAMDYRGFIFFGLMVKEDCCKLLEYNVRLGDPETQAVLPLADFDFTALCLSIHEGTLGDFPLRWKKGAVCAPVAVAGGYPGPYRKGDPITIDRPAIEGAEARVFIAGGTAEEGLLKTSGGRVLALSAWGTDAEEARQRAYRGLEGISFNGMDYRRDIGNEAAR